MMIHTDDYTRHAQILRVVDGDTFDALVDLGFRAYSKIRIRLKGADTPETYRPRNDAEREHGKRATDFVAQLIDGKSVVLTSYKAAIYGRWEANVWFTNEDGVQESLAKALTKAGLLKRGSYP